MVTYTPASAGVELSGVLYFTSMLGAVFGAALSWVRRSPFVKPGVAGALAACVILETAWVLFNIGHSAQIFPCTSIATVLGGFGTARLLVMWLALFETNEPGEELVGYSVALGGAFLLYGVISALPPQPFIGYLYAPATTIALIVYIRRCRNWVATDAFPRPATVVHETAERVGWPVMVGCACMFVSLGIGLEVIGHGGPNVDLGIAIASVVLAVPMFIKRLDVESVGMVAPCLATIGLACAALQNAGAPFAMFLSGCVCLCGWFLLEIGGMVGGSLLGDDLIVRREACGSMAVIFATAFAGIGVALGTALLRFLGDGVSSVLVALMAVVVSDAFWRVAVHMQMVTRAESEFVSSVASPLPDDACELQAEALAKQFGLTSRETQVARLLCQNRSVSYICASMGLATSTVKTHVRHVYEKTGVHSKDELQLLGESLCLQSGQA